MNMATLGNRDSTVLINSYPKVRIPEQRVSVRQVSVFVLQSHVVSVNIEALGGYFFRQVRGIDDIPFGIIQIGDIVRW
jgi:hypothetical protein